MASAAPVLSSACPNPMDAAMVKRTSVSMLDRASDPLTQPVMIMKPAASMAACTIDSHSIVANTTIPPSMISATGARS